MCGWAFVVVASRKFVHSIQFSVRNYVDHRRQCSRVNCLTHRTYWLHIYCYCQGGYFWVLCGSLFHFTSGTHKFVTETILCHIHQWLLSSIVMENAMLSTDDSLTSRPFVCVLHCSLSHSTYDRFHFSKWNLVFVQLRVAFRFLLCVAVRLWTWIVNAERLCRFETAIATKPDTLFVLFHPILSLTPYSSQRSFDSFKLSYR